MPDAQTECCRKRQAQFLADLLEPKGPAERRHWGRVHVRSLLPNGERKSIEPLAARLPEANVQAMQQFIGQSPWEWTPVWERGHLVGGNARLGGQMRLLTRRLAGLPTFGSERVSGLVTGGRKLWARVLKSTTGRGKSDTAFEMAQKLGWESLSRAGEDAFKNGHSQVAAMHFSQAVQEAEQFGEGDARLGKTLNRLGAVQCRLGRYPEAERSLKRAAHILERTLGASDLSVLEALSNLAGAYKATGEYQTAKSIYDRVLGAAEDLAGPAHPLIAWTLDALGDLHVAQGESSAALYAYRRALSIKEQALGQGGWDVAVTLDKLVEFYCGRGRYNEAEPLLWRSLEIRKTVLGDCAPAVAKLYIRLGSLYATQRKFARAERLLRYGISMSSATEQTNEAVPHLHKLAKVYEGMARFSDAEALRNLAQSILSTPSDADKAFAREFNLTRLAVPRSPSDSDLRWAHAIR